MLFVTHSACVPLLSESRYLCISNTRLVVVPSGFVTVCSAAKEPLDTRLSAEDQTLPGRRIIWLVAPTPRIADTTAWTVAAQVVMLGTDIYVRHNLETKPVEFTHYHVAHSSPQRQYVFESCTWLRVVSRDL